MVRNSVKYVSYKDLKEVTKDLKKIYTAATEEMAHFELNQFEILCGDFKYDLLESKK